MKNTKDLLAFSLEWDKAIAENNIEEMKRYMSPEWVSVATEGGITTLHDFLANIRSGDLVHTRMDTDESRVKVYGDTGIVTGKGTSAGTWNGAPFSFYEWSTSVFIWKDERWSCVLTMLTPA